MVPFHGNTGHKHHTVAGPSDARVSLLVHFYHCSYEMMVHNVVVEQLVVVEEPCLK